MEVKTHVLMISRAFPSTHKRAGQPTFFKEKCINGLAQLHGEDCKIHTIRANFPLWHSRIKDVQDGSAVLSLRYWSGRPYNSKQVQFAVLDMNSGVGVQILQIYPDWMTNLWNNDYITSGDYPKVIFPELLAKNDGLILDDFKDWFKGYDLNEPLAVIQFTNFRY